jgi:hypothetical protein
MIPIFILQNLFAEQTDFFGLSSGALFVSIFFLFGYKNALKPSERGIGAPINRIKKRYERNGELHKYQSLCKILFFTAICVSACTLVLGLIQILFHSTAI